MSRKIFVNLPIKDLAKSIDFFTKVGFTFNAQFTDDKATCMVITPEIFSMLLTEDFYKTFIPTRTIADAKTTSEVLVCLSCDSKQEVDEIMQRALDAGATEELRTQDYGETMYGRAFSDLDGHVWELMWMDPSIIK